MVSASVSSARSVSAASSELAAAMAARNRLDSSSALPCRRTTDRTSSASSTSGPRARPGETGVPCKQTTGVVSLPIVVQIGEIALHELRERARRLVGITAVGSKIQGRHEWRLHCHHAGDAFRIGPWPVFRKSDPYVGLEALRELSQLNGGARVQSALVRQYGARLGPRYGS